MKPTHRISDLHLELTFENDAPRLQPMADEDLLALARAHILPALACALDQEDDGRLRHIGRLEIDLGQCAAHDYATTIPPLLERLVREALGRHDSASASAPLAGQTAARREPLEHFLLTGQVPSWAPEASLGGSRLAHERLLARSLAAPADGALKALLRRCASSPDAIRRLAQQFDAASLRLLVLHIETPAAATGWLSVVDDIAAALNMAQASGRQDLRQFWEILLAEVLGGDTWGAVRSAPEALRQAAAALVGRPVNTEPPGAVKVRHGGAGLALPRHMLLHELLHSRLGILRPAVLPHGQAASHTAGATNAGNGDNGGSNASNANGNGGHASNHAIASSATPWHGAAAASGAPDLELEALFVENAGQVLIGPYMPRLFSMLDLTEAGKFKSAEAAERAAHLLQCVIGAPSDTPEVMLGLNKILCGIPAGTAIAREITITGHERETIDMMLRAIIEHWKKIGNTTPDGLRQSFLRRAGRMHLQDDAWYLNVERGTFDMLLDSLPWSFSIIKHPWMERAVHVNWR